MDAAGILLKLEDIRRLLHASCCCPLYVRCLDGGKGLLFPSHASVDAHTKVDEGRETKMS
jgi:hypothetical protein